MSATLDALGVDVFATCPPSTESGGPDYVRRVADVARWSERHGCRGILVYTDGRLVDPWLVSQLIVAETARLSPLVAVQPVYMHPYTVAKMVASFAHLHGRRLHLNMVAGGFKNDLTALADDTPHDQRYARLTEYSLVVKRLLAEKAVSHHGAFYRMERVSLQPAPPPDLVPDFFVSGSSAPGLAAARALGAVAVRYPEPGREAAPADLQGVRSGVRVGVLARETDEAAWAAAHARFPEDRRGQLTHAMAMKVSDSSWHRQLSRLEASIAAGPWWMHPFTNYETFCPYLVGSYDRVGAELARFLAAGERVVILDVPADEDDLGHAAQAFACAGAPAARGTAVAA